MLVGDFRRMRRALRGGLLRSQPVSRCYWEAGASSSDAADQAKQLKEQRQRSEALETLRARGTELYPATFKPSTSVSSFKATFGHVEPGSKDVDTVVQLAGRVSSRRESSKKLVFLDLESEGETVQVMANRSAYGGDAEAFEAIAMAVRRGDLIGVQGHPARTKVGELSLVPTEITLLAPCLHNLPSPGTLKDPSLRLRRRYLEMLVNQDLKKALQVRAQVLGYMRRFLEDRGFLEVETPTLAATAGGALAKPFTTESQAPNTTTLPVCVCVCVCVRALLLPSPPTHPPIQRRSPLAKPSASST